MVSLDGEYSYIGIVVRIEHDHYEGEPLPFYVTYWLFRGHEGSAYNGVCTRVHKDRLQLHQS